ncbi:hypothetical protein ABID77_001250 [Variovorax sp. PvP013]
MTRHRPARSRHAQDAVLRADCERLCAHPVAFRGSELPLGHFFSVTPP